MLVQSKLKTRERNKRSANQNVYRSYKMNNTGETDSVEATISVVVFILSLILGLVGHGLVLLVVLGKTGSRTASDVFIMNLSISDLAFLILSLTINSHSYTGSFQFSLFYCKFVWPMITATFFAGVFTLTSMAVHRCNGVLRPLKANFTARQATIWSGCIWILAVIPVSPLMIITGLTENEDSCDEKWSMSSKQAFTVAMFLFQYAIPLTIITIAYVQIVRCLRHRKIPGTAVDRYGHTICSKSNRRENIQIIKTVAVIVILFAVCMLPHEIIGFIYYFGDNSSEESQKRLAHLLTYSAILLYIHSCLNPLVYGIITHQFYKEYKRYLMMLLCCCGRRARRLMIYQSSYNKSRSTQKSILKKSYTDTKPPSGDSIELVRSQTSPKDDDDDGTQILEDTRI